MPSAGQKSRLAFWTNCPEEVHGFVMGVGQSDGYYLMSCSNHKMIIQSVGYMELFQCNLTAFFHLCLVFAVFGILYLVGIAGSSGLEFHFNAQVPVLIELIVASQYKTGDRNGVTLKVTVSLSCSVEAVNAVVLELGQYLSIATNAVATVTIHLRRIVIPLGVSCGAY